MREGERERERRDGSGTEKKRFFVMREGEKTIKMFNKMVAKARLVFFHHNESSNLNHPEAA